MLTAVLPTVADSHDIGWGPRVRASLQSWRFSIPGHDLPLGPSSRWIEIAGIGKFAIDWQRKLLIAQQLRETVTSLDLQHIVQDHLVPRLLAETGLFVLHAGAVDMGGALALFLGESGAGKSTLAASLHARGHPLLGDDAMVVERAGNGFEGSAVYRSLRLYDDSLQTAFKGAARSAPMADYSVKRQVLVEADPATPEGPLPIAALFFLSGPGWDSAPAASLLTPTKACIELVGQSFSLDVRDPKCGARRLAQASGLALAVPAYQLSYRHDYDDLDAVHAMIEQVVASARSAAAEGVAR